MSLLRKAAGLAEQRIDNADQRCRGHGPGHRPVAVEAAVLAGLLQHIEAVRRQAPVQPHSDNDHRINREQQRADAQPVSLRQVVVG
jgi:hypothetical protein